MEKVFYFLVVTAVIVTLTSCGGGSSSGSGSTGGGSSTLSGTLDGLEDVPSSSEMFSTNSGSANLSAKTFINPAVSGTAPLLSAITSNNVDTYFWNGMLEEINTAGSATDDQVDQFWGGVDGGVGGEGACRMAQSVGYTMENILRSQTSLCYMKGMPAVTSGGVSVVSGSLEDPTTIFDQQASDRVVQVTVSGFEDFSGEEGADEMKIFIKVFGSDSIGSDAYNIDLWFCDTGGPTADSYEQIEIDKSAGTYSHTDVGTGTREGSAEVWLSSISGSLSVDADGNVIFDPATERSANFQFSSDQWGTMKSQIVVSGDNQITAKDYNIFTGGGEISCTNKHYSISGFSGTSLNSLRFTEAGYKGESNCGDNDFSYQGGVEYQDNYYAATTSSELATEVADFDFDSDSHFNSAPGAPEIDTSAYSCSVTPDIVVNMNFSDSAVAAVAQTCELEQLSNMNWCDGAAIQSARNIIFESFQQQ